MPIATTAIRRSEAQPRQVMIEPPLGKKSGRKPVITSSSLASSARLFWRLLEHYRVDPAFVFREAGLDPALMDEPRGRYKVERRIRGWRKAAELIDDPCFGLKAAEMWAPNDLHALGCAFLASATLRKALGRLSRYAQVFHDAMGLDLADEGVNLCIALRLDPAFQTHFLAAQEDATWAYLIRMCRVGAGEALDPVEVRFLHPAPSCPGDYYGLFRCPVHFGAPASEIRFALADVERPFSTANRELARANDRILTDFLSKLRKDDLIARVKAAIAEELPSGSPSEEAIAKDVFMSPRTLQRKLSAQGASFSQLLDAVRRQLAEQYLSDPSLSLSEIGFLLGFREQSTFTRAFRRWTGKAPSAMRDTAAA